VELTEAGSQVRTLDFEVVTQVEDRPYNYSLMIQQVDCSRESNQLKAPAGCFQYFDEEVGVIDSFNFDAGQYMNNQNYRICIGAVNQSCALSLSAADGHFGIHQSHPRQVFIDRSAVGAQSCNRDYLWIHHQNRHCGAYLSPVHGDTQSRPVISGRYGSVYQMEFRTAVPARFDTMNRGAGFRLAYRQLAADSGECPARKVVDDKSARPRWNRMQILA